jgi:hypothetical protein
MLMEVSKAEAQPTSIVQWDLAGFYESIHLGILVPQCMKVGFPAWQLAMGTQAALFPRSLQLEGAIGDPIQWPTRSLVTGCILSNEFARALLHEALHAMAYRIPHAPTDEFVDDLAQVVACHNDDQRRTTLLESARLLAHHTEKLQLVISTKSVIIPDDHISREVVAVLTKEGIPIRTTNTGEDLGIGTTGAVRRTASTLNTRLAKATKRARRVNCLTKHSKEAKKLYATGVKPQQTYGMTAAGISPTTTRTMRRHMATCAGGAPTGACLRTFVAMEYPKQRRP